MESISHGFNIPWDEPHYPSQETLVAQVRRSLSRQLTSKLTARRGELTEDFKKNVARQAWLRCYSKEAAVASLGGRKFGSGEDLAPTPNGAAAPSIGASADSAESLRGSARNSGDLLRQSNASPGGPAVRRPGRRSSASLAVTAEMAAMLQAQLQQRMFGARQGTYAHSDEAALLLARRVQGSKLTRRERCFLFLEEPGASRSAFCFGAAMWTLLLLSAAFAALESLTRWREENGVSNYPFLVAKIFFNVCFTLEALARVATYIPLSQAVQAPSLWLDVLTVVPFWVRVVTAPDSLSPDVYSERSADEYWLRVFESLATLRLLKLARYYEGAELLNRAIAKSATQLLVPMFMLFIMVMCSSVLLVELEWSSLIESCLSYWQEQGVPASFLRNHRDGVEWSCDAVCGGVNGSAPFAGASDDDRLWVRPDESANDAALERWSLCATCRGYPDGHPECLGRRWVQQYPDVPTAMWFLLVSVTPAVALDPGVYPATWRGQLFIFALIPLGILFLAMPLSTVGANFNAVWQERQLVKLQRLVRQLLVENGKDATDCKIAFEQFDTDNSGEISWKEFSSCVREVLGLQLPRKELLALWRKLDDTRSGAINLHQFADAIFPNAAATEQVATERDSMRLEATPVKAPNSRASRGADEDVAALAATVNTLRQDMNAMRGEMSTVRAEMAKSTDQVLAELRRLSAAVARPAPVAVPTPPAADGASSWVDPSPDSRPNGRLSA